MKPTALDLHPHNTEQLIEAYSTIMRKHLREHTEGTNVNRHTLLTTDYLNHYAGMVMLLEQLPETPEELILYLLSWEPVSYEQHFTTSGFREASLAVAAYRHAPENVRATFDQIIERLHQESIRALDFVRNQAEAGNSDAFAMLCAEKVPLLRDLIVEASAIVNQQPEGENSQSAIDEMF
jgi:hypothetical protein